MATRHQWVRCPHCKEVVSHDTRSGGAKVIRYGTPIQTCHKCKKRFLDSTITEAARKPLSFYRKRALLMEIGVLFQRLAFFNIFFIPMILDNGLNLNILQSALDASQDTLGVWGMLFPILGFLCIGVLLSHVFDVGTYFDNEFIDEYRESAQRLSDPAYVALIEAIESHAKGQDY